MSFTITSIKNSVNEGKSYKLLQYENYAPVNAITAGKTTRKIGSKQYTFRRKTLKLDYSTTEQKNLLVNDVTDYIVMSVSERTNTTDTVQFRIKLQDDLYYVMSFQKTENLLNYQVGLENKNVKKTYGDYRISANIDNGDAHANSALALFGFVDENSDVWLSAKLVSLKSPGLSREETYYNLSDIGTVIYEEFSDEYGEYSGGGGYGGGSFDDSSDAFGLPSLPSLGVSEVGFINVYNPSKGQLQGFADELFPDFQMPTPSTATGIEAVAENLANTFQVLGDFAESYVNAGLINYVIDCHIVPVAPVTNSTSKIKVGFKTFNYTPAKVTSDYVEFDCGSLEIAEYYQNFLDYEGTKAKLYLPFIGFVDIKPEWFQSGKLGVTYHFNTIDGSCIAFVIATSSKSNLKETVVATFGGNCCVHMPITGVNYSSMISGVVGGAVGIASNASNMIKTNRADKGTVMSNIEGATGIASNLADAVGAKPSIEQSNGYNAGMSFMCYRRPYLLIERPVASFSKNYPREQGLPLNVTRKLGSMKGFTTCTAPVVDNFHCLEEEKEMIKQALIEGTIF